MRSMSPARIGDSGGGLAIFKREKHALCDADRDALIARYRVPQPPVAFAAALARHRHGLGRCLRRPDRRSGPSGRGLRRAHRRGRRKGSAVGAAESLVGRGDTDARGDCWRRLPDCLHRARRAGGTVHRPSAVSTAGEGVRLTGRWRGSGGAQAGLSAFLTNSLTAVLPALAHEKRASSSPWRFCWPLPPWRRREGRRRQEGRRCGRHQCRSALSDGATAGWRRQADWAMPISPRA